MHSENCWHHIHINAFWLYLTILFPSPSSPPPKKKSHSLPKEIFRANVSTDSVWLLKLQVQRTNCISLLLFSHGDSKSEGNLGKRPVLSYGNPFAMPFVPTWHIISTPNELARGATAESRYLTHLPLHLAGETSTDQAAVLSRHRIANDLGHPKVSPSWHAKDA